jgi:hypothetical protein
VYTHAFDRLVEHHRCRYVFVQFVDETGGLRNATARLVDREHPYGKFKLPRGEVVYIPIDKIRSITSAEVPA